MQGFVGPLGVEGFDEAVEVVLLLEAVPAWRPGGFLLEGGTARRCG